MLKNLTYRKKLKYLFIGIPVVFFLAYYFSFSATLNAYLKVNELEEMSKSQESIFQSLKIQSNELTEVDAQLGMFDTEVSREFIIAVVSEFCVKNKLKLKEVLPEELYVSNDLNISTEILSVKGYYHDLLKLLEYLEVHAHIGKITSVHFEKIKDKESRKVELVAKFYIQNIAL